MYFMKTFLSVGSAPTLQEPVGSMVNITIDKDMITKRNCKFRSIAGVSGLMSI